MWRILTWYREGWPVCNLACVLIVLLYSNSICFIHSIFTKKKKDNKAKMTSEMTLCWCNNVNQLSAKDTPSRRPHLLQKKKKPGGNKQTKKMAVFCFWCECFILQDKIGFLAVEWERGSKRRATFQVLSLKYKILFTRPNCFSLYLVRPKTNSLSSICFHFPLSSK